MSEQSKAEQWQRVKLVLARALELPRPERARYLDDACRSESALRAEVESLLAYEDAVTTSAGSTGTHAAAGPGDIATPGVLEGSAPDRIGSYRVIRSLGRGGMGTVYLAKRDDAEYEKEVAIKLIRHDVSSEMILQRFRTERQILAALDHPNLARLLDGGTTETGVPFLVMDYIDGVPIHKYCDEHRLNVDERIGLFRHLCAAVHYAHQHLVVHRDIKPENILVTADGIPKLLDFGIAKLLSPEIVGRPVDPTATGLWMLTPRYASPEQVRGGLITTASDVYSLGVVLYELLTGQSPYPPMDSMHDIILAVCEAEPERPSIVVDRIVNPRANGSTEGSAVAPETVSRARMGEPGRLRRRLRGDIDNIVLKALAKEPDRRYGSAEQLSEDLQWHLEGLPVGARQPTVLYRARKFAGRHKAAVIAAVLVSATIVGGTVGINRQRLRAERRFNDVRKLAHAVVFDYHDAIADLPGSTPVRQRLVKDALAYLDSLAGEARDDQDLQRELAAAYVKIGDVQGNSNMDNLGDMTGALQSYRKSLAIRDALASALPANVAVQRELAECRMRIGDVLSDTGDIDQAFDSYHNAMLILEKLSAVSPEDLSLQQSLAQAYASVGDIKGNPFLPNLGDPTASLEYHRKALAIREKFVKITPGDTELSASLVDSHRTLAGILLSGGDLDAAERYAHAAVAVAQASIADAPNSVRATKALANARESLCRVLMTMEEWDEALLVFQDILAADRSVADADPQNAQARRYLADDYTQIGHILANQGKHAEALKSYRQALALDESLVTTDPNNDSARYAVTVDHLSIGDVLVQMGDLTAALASQRTAVSSQEALVLKDPEDMQAALNLAMARDRCSETHFMLGNFLEALSGVREGVPVGERALAQDPANNRARRQLGLRCFRLGECYFQLGARPGLSGEQRSGFLREARQGYQRSLTLLQELQAKGALPPEHSKKLEIITRRIAECDGTPAAPPANP